MLIDYVKTRIHAGYATDLIFDPRPLVDFPDRCVLVARHSESARDIVIKADTIMARAQREQTIGGFLRAFNVPVVNQRWAESGPPMITVSDRLIGTRPENNAAWHVVGKELARIHHLTTLLALPSRRIYENWELMLATLNSFAPSGVEQIYHRFGRTTLDRLGQEIDQILTIKPNQTFIHGDAQPEHFFLAGSKLTGIIDFGDAGTGDPMWDLAVLTIRNPDVVSSLAEGYGEINDERIKAYWVVRMIGAIAWRNSRGLNSEREVEDLEHNLALRGLSSSS